MSNVIYGRDEARRACLEYFNGEELPSDVLVSKYLLRNDKNELVEKSPVEMFERVASEFFRIEQNYPNSMTLDEIHGWLDGFKYIVPQGSPLFGIGNDYQTCSLANCFVIKPVEDSYGDIFRADEELAQVMKRRGGAGLDISNLRPAGISVNNAARSSEGGISFMHRFSNTTKEVAQGGRRGALMCSTSVKNVDIDKFINIKRDKTAVTGANISIRFTDDFMNAVKEDTEFALQWPIEGEAKISKTVKAKQLWDNFIQAVWESAEPGCLFWDTITENSLADCYAKEGFKSVGVNPCSELSLSEYGSCELMLLNLKSFVKNQEFDFNLFKKACSAGIRLMDDMIDLELEKIDKILAKIENDPESNDVKFREKQLWLKIKETHVKGRRIGFGVTALADCIALMGLKYGADDSLVFVDKLFSEMNNNVMEATALLAKERGTFPIWDWQKEKDICYIKRCTQETQDLIKKHGRRNIALTTIAPAGTISILTQTSSGCEPVYLRKYVRRRKVNAEDKARGIKVTSVDADGIEWTEYDIIHPPLKYWLLENPGKTEKDSPWNGCQADEISWERRVQTQATLQKYINSSISSTVNLPENTTKDIISNIYMRAWELGCKGITVYRDNCRQNILSSTHSKTPVTTNMSMASAPKRPDVLECDIHYSTVQKDAWIFFIGKLDGQPYEIFGGPKKNIELPKRIKTGWIKKNGVIDGIRTYDLIVGSLTDENERMVIKDIASEFNADVGSYTRLVSTMLRHGIPIKFIAEQLNKDKEGVHMFTLEKVMARVLKRYIKDGEVATGACSECGGKLAYKDGCVSCVSCGYSKCS